MIEKSKDLSLKVFQKEKLKDKLFIKERGDFTSKQKELINLILDKKSQIVLIDGPAGTSKTFLAVYCGLKQLNEKKQSDIIYIRTLIESASKGIGYLPGESYEKFKPFIIPLEDKLQELLNKNDIDKLFKEDRIKPIPVNFARGASWDTKYIIFDECQNATQGEIITILTRIGKFSKIILTGDSYQSDLNGKSGFKKIIDIFDNQESKDNGIFAFKLTKEDIVRSGVIKFILEKIENSK